MRRGGGRRDQIGAWPGRPPHLISAIGDPGADAVRPCFEAVVPSTALWRNAIAARLARELGDQRRHAGQLGEEGRQQLRPAICVWAPHTHIEAAGLLSIVRHSGLEQMPVKPLRIRQRFLRTRGTFDYGSASSVPCPTNATSPPTFTVSPRFAVPSRRTRNVLGWPVNWPWFRMKVSPPRTSPWRRR